MPQRFLIVRTSAIGDVVFASGLPAAIRHSHPDAHIAWLVEPGIDGLLLPDPNIDEIILWPKAQWAQLWRSGHKLALWQQVRQLRHTLRQRHFDVALDLQGLLKSGLLTWLSGARERIGLGSKEGSQWLMTRTWPRGGDKALIGSEYRFLAEQLGLDTTAFAPQLWVSPDTETRVQTLLAQHGLAVGRYAVLAPFTTRPQKHWFEDAWRVLLSRIQHELGLTPVMLGGPADQTAATRITQGLDGVVSLVGATRLPEAAGVIRHAGLLVGVDTGLTHMGTAFRVPTVAIFGSTVPYTRTGHANGRVIWLGLTCSPCRRRPTCHGAHTCLRDITPERVLAEARDALASESAP